MTEQNNRNCIQCIDHQDGRCRSLREAVQELTSYLPELTDDDAQARMERKMAQDCVMYEEADHVVQSD